MLKSKEEIMRKALLRISKCGGKSSPLALVDIARNALNLADDVKKYRIEAKTWYSQTNLSNSMFKVVLREMGSDEILLKLQGYDPGAWPIRFAHYMTAQMPEQFPDRKGQLCSIWFRETLGIEVLESEVPLKRNLGL